MRRFRDGETQSAIALSLGINEKTVRRVVHRIIPAAPALQRDRLPALLGQVRRR